MGFQNSLNEQISKKTIPIKELIFTKRTRINFHKIADIRNLILLDWLKP